MMHIPILSLLILLPLSGVLFLLLVKSNSPRNAKAVAFWISSLNLVLALILLYEFDPNNADFQFVEKHAWIESLKCSYHVGVDGLSVYFVVLSALLTPICITSSFTSVNIRIRAYMMAFLFLESLVIGVFCSLDLVLFYLFFEGVLIPMFLLIGLWGGERRLYACFKFFLYTFFASVFMLIAFIKLYNDAGTTNLLDVLLLTESLDVQKWLFLALAFAFAVKIPVWPFHTWLPDAHTEAPTAGSVILAGILLKLGGYGLLRIVLPLLPDAAHAYSTGIIILSLISIVYGSLVAFAQTDIKKLIAYSSVAHMGFVTLGIFTFSQQGYSGAVMQMLSHGLVTSALFLAFGMLYERYHTREISMYQGLLSSMPKFSTFFFIALLGSIGLPGTSGFVGEFLVLMSAFKVHKLYTIIASLGVILGAVYMLSLYRRVFTGKVVARVGAKGSPTPSAPVPQVLGVHMQAAPLVLAAKTNDLSNKEVGFLFILIALILFLGVYPNAVLNGISATYLKVYSTSLKK